MTEPNLRLIVTGSRNWTNSDFVEAQLTLAFARAQVLNRGLTIVQGECPEGPDRFSARWAMEQMRWGSPVDIDPFPADWGKGLSGGFRRNEKMVKAGAWVLLGFVADCIKPDCRRPRPHGSHGTMHCLKVGKAYKIPVIRAWKTKNWSS